MKTAIGSRINRLTSTIIVALMCTVLAVTACTNSGGGNGAAEPIEWDVTLIGEEELVLSYDEIIAMPSYEGRGGFFTTVGIMNGPYEAKGVLLEDLCDLVGGIGAEDAVKVSAPDGYSMVFSYDQVQGDFITHDPATMSEVPHGELKLILMYEQDDLPLSDADGKPLRLAIVGSEALLTTGHYWVKWVDEVEVISSD